MSGPEIRPQRVLFVIGSMGGGGAERQVVEMLKRLDRRKFQPVLYLSHREGDLLSEVPGDVEIHSFWDHYAGTWKSKVHHLLGLTARARCQHLAETIRRERIDLVFDHCYLATVDAAVAARLARVPRISMCVVDPMTEIQFYSRGNEQREFLRAREMYGTAQRVLAVSQGVQRGLIEDLDIPVGTVRLHYNMIDVAEAQRLSQAYDPQFDPHRIHIVTAARLAPQKAHRDILAALERLVSQYGRRELMWHFVGDGPLSEELASEIARRGLLPYVHMAGFQRNPYPYYRHAHLFCLASTYEGFGCVLMEALACGLPVISTDCPSGPREVLDDGRAGLLVPPRDPAALAAAVDQCLSDTEAARERTTHGQQFVAQTFGLDVGIPRLEALFEEVLNEARTATSPAVAVPS